MKKHIQLLALSLLVIIAAIYTACQKEEENVETILLSEESEGRFEKDFTIYDTQNGTIFTVHIASNEQSLVDLFNAETVNANWTTESEGLVVEEDSHDDVFKQSLPDGRKIVTVYLKYIQATTDNVDDVAYGMSFSDDILVGLEAAKAKMVVRLDKTEISNGFSRDYAEVSCKKLRVKGTGKVTTRMNWGPNGWFRKDLHVGMKINPSTWSYCIICEHGYPKNTIKELEGGFTSFQTRSKCDSNW
ncbi:MAG: hypothetical protein KIS77_17480 [Saprospiraceae bacterium]|nr:hypothetical protein [Saprospiraceae bacterium]